MNIKKWLELKAMRPSHLAKSAGISVGTMHKILNNGNPSLSTMRKIEVATDGAVTPNDWSKK